MNTNKLKTLILSLTQDIEFEFMGIKGCIIPINSNDISITFDNKTNDYKNINDAMNDKIFNGKSLIEISEQLIL